jgi:hypothetical protein
MIDERIQVRCLLQDRQIPAKELASEALESLVVLGGAPLTEAREEAGKHR